jgi:transposase
MKNHALVVGVDVSKAKLDVCFMREAPAKDATHLVVPNTAKGMASILAQIQNTGIDTRAVLFCFEHTGVYSVPLSMFLQAQGIDYWIVPAIEIKRSKGLRRGKTDKNDARDIAHYALTQKHKMQLSSVPEAELTELRCLLAEREKIVKAIVLFQSTEEGEGLLPKAVLKRTLSINKKALTALNKRLKETDTAIRMLIKAHPLMCRQYELATSVPGVGPQTALYLIALTRCFAAFPTWRKLACYAGIAPFEYSSGSSIRGKTKVSPLANQKLKSLFNMAALSARKLDPELRMYYERKRAEGKHVMSVMNAVRCKVVARVFAAINRNTPFVNTLKFAA